MNQRDDLRDATPGDWLAVVRDGQSWGFPQCYGQGGTVCKGVPQPIAVLDKHAAASDVTIVTGQLGATVGTAALVAEWAKGAVLRVPLAENGPTSTSKRVVVHHRREEPGGAGAERTRPVRRRLGHRDDLRDRAGVSQAATCPTSTP